MRQVLTFNILCIVQQSKDDDFSLLSWQFKNLKKENHEYPCDV